MTRKWNRRFWGGVVAGLAAGLLVGVGMMVGTAYGTRTNSAQTALDEIKLRASASNGTDTFVIATGAVDEEAEGLFCLDFITGEMQCFVLDGRTGRTAGWFKTNVSETLKRADDSKKAKYVLVTGLFSARGVTGNARPAACLIYVADAMSGDIAAYTFPWNQAAKNSFQGQAAKMTVVATFKGRTVELRE